MHDVVVVGAGMAGCAAALWCARLDLSVAWVEAGDALGGQLLRTHSPITDYPGLPAAGGVAFVARLREQLAATDLAPRLDARVTAIEDATAVLEGGERLTGRALVLCTGARPRRLGLPGEAELLSAGAISLSASRDRDGAAGRRAVVVGGGDGAVENALLLARRGAAHVTLVHRGGRLRARAELRRRLAAEAPEAELLLATRVTALERDAGGALAAVRLIGPGGERTLSCARLFLKIGVSPASELVADRVACDAQGYVRTDADQRTSAPAVLAAGDVCNPGRPSLAAAAGQAAVAIKAIRDEPAG